jgi:hypothetical protein
VRPPSTTIRCPRKSISAGESGDCTTFPLDAKVFLPASIEQSVGQYFSAKAEQKGVGLSELLTDVLKRDIEINEALK